MGARNRLGRDSAVYEVARMDRWASAVGHGCSVARADPAGPPTAQGRCSRCDDTASVIVRTAIRAAHRLPTCRFPGCLMMLVPLLGLIYATIVGLPGVTGFRYARLNPTHGRERSRLDRDPPGHAQVIVGIGATVFAVARMLG